MEMANIIGCNGQHYVSDGVYYYYSVNGSGLKVLSLTVATTTTQGLDLGNALLKCSQTLMLALILTWENSVS